MGEGDHQLKAFSPHRKPDLARETSPHYTATHKTQQTAAVSTTERDTAVSWKLPQASGLQARGFVIRTFKTNGFGICIYSIPLWNQNLSMASEM